MNANPTAQFKRFTRRSEKQHYHEIRSLPIQMKDRRVLYNDLQTIYNFERQIRQKSASQRRICCFSLRLLWNRLVFNIKSYEMWQTSLREIEIQRGTLTANVFYFIKHTLFFNLYLAVIVLIGIYIPHIAFGYYFEASTISPYNETSNCTGLEKYELAACCFKNAPTANRSSNHKLQWMVNISNFLGGEGGTWDKTFFFYGHYSSYTATEQSHSLLAQALAPLYLLSVIVVLVYSYSRLVKNIADGVHTLGIFRTMEIKPTLHLKYSGMSVRMQEIVRNKDGDVCQFSELIFCGYYHRTQSENEARFRRKLWLHNLRVAVKQAKAWSRVVKNGRRILFIRIFMFVSIGLVIGGVAFAIYKIFASCDTLIHDLPKSQREELTGLLTKISINLLPSLAVGVANIVLPNLFIRLSKLERYSLEGSTALILYRSLTVRLLSVVVAMVRIFGRKNDKADNDTPVYCLNVKKNTCRDCEGQNGKERYACWESVLAREFYKILFVELALKVFLSFVVDPLRKMLKKLFFRIPIMRKIGTLRFNVIRHSIDIINVQVMCWIGFYFAPAYPLAVCFYLFVVFYVKKFSVLVNCVGVPEAYKVTRTTTIFTSGKLVSFMMVLIFLVVAMGMLEPSRGCGPFAIFPSAWGVWDDVFRLDDKNSYQYYILEHVSALSVYTPLIFISITILYHFYSRRNHLQEMSESVKELIYLENQDKQYLVNKLLALRSINRKENYYDPYSVFDSEKRLIESSNKRGRLNKQWKEMKAANLPVGVNLENKTRGRLSQQMKNLGGALRAESSSTTETDRRRPNKAAPKSAKTNKLRKKIKKKLARAKPESKASSRSSIGPATRKANRSKKKFKGNLKQLVDKIQGKKLSLAIRKASVPTSVVSSKSGSTRSTKKALRESMKNNQADNKSDKTSITSDESDSKRSEQSVDQASTDESRQNKGYIFEGMKKGKRSKGKKAGSATKRQTKAFFVDEKKK